MLVMVDAVEFAFDERPEVPQARPHPLDGLVDAVLRGLVRVLRLGGVQSRAAVAGQVLVVGAGPVAQRLPLRVGGVHGGQGVDIKDGEKMDRGDGITSAPSDDDFVVAAGGVGGRPDLNVHARFLYIGAWAGENNARLPWNGTILVGNCPRARFRGRDAETVPLT